MENQRRDLNEEDESTNSVFTLTMIFATAYFSIISWVINKDISTMYLIRDFTVYYWFLRAADRAVFQDALKANATSHSKKIISSAICDTAYNATPAVPAYVRVPPPGQQRQCVSPLPQQPPHQPLEHMTQQHTTPFGRGC